MGGYKVTKGQQLLVPLGHVSRSDPRWAGETGDLSPEVFNPERMLTPEGQKPGWQVPFGHGGRHCLGVHLANAEMKVFLALFAQGYAAQVDTNTEWVYLVGRVPVSGLPTRLEKLPAAAPAAA
ncbi:hypothetical protein MNEG_15646 [Monoraphidium neglectum]|uniref:Cytochrome P450 n=1 Tax=Monoraphidium neglectum TaxID=145388 RepID=A0A0D2LQU6_9CHLO|nr:hypothetical protein MNEG_15646 [Monoraphidium neglectum]KIY92316.1 hypothetical protein MNEG_15646 [Monoraphidium neglectum]|eukprot:XP_013891336.1 hypothetical protein MNEG_15646 [Monoraphidium neglectum]